MRLPATFTPLDYPHDFLKTLKNKPVSNTLTDVTSNATGVVTVLDEKSGKFLYKVRPGSETSVAFGKLDGGEISARITDREIQVGGIRVENCSFGGNMAGVVVDPSGGVGIGAPLPPIVLKLLTSR
jgi:hypothetical protein